MAEPVEQPPVEVAGLEIPADVAPQIIKALRSLYPTLTDGKEDDPAVRAVLVWFITSALETQMTREAAATFDATVEQMRGAHTAKVNQMRGQIQAAARRIKEKQTITPPAE